MASLPTKSFMRKDKKGSAHRNRPYKRGKRSVAQRLRRRYKEVQSNLNPLENEVTLTDCGTTQSLQLNSNPNSLENEVILTDWEPTQSLHFRANDPPVCLDANITVPYIEHEIVEQVVSQTPPCHTLSQEIVEPIIPKTFPCHTLKQSFPVASSSRKSKVINVTERILPKRSPIDLPYDAVCTERIDEPVPDFLPEKRQWIVKKKVLLSTGGHNGKIADSCRVKGFDVVGKRFMTLGEANLISNNLYKTRFTYSSSQRKPKPQLGQSINNSGRNLLIKPAVSNVSNHSILGEELIPPDKIKVEDEVEVVENEFHESPEAVISSLNQKKWNSSLSRSCLNPVTTMIARSPSTQWFMNTCTSAVTTETVTTFASTSGRTVCTSTSALSNACLSSTSTTPMLISSCAQPSTPCNRYVSSLPINPAPNVPTILVPQRPAAKSNSDLIFNSLLPTQSNQSHSLVTNFPIVANDLNNSSVPTRIRNPSSNVNSSLPIKTIVLNKTINSTLCDTNLSSTLAYKKMENELTLFDKNAKFLPDRNNVIVLNINTALSHTKNTTLSDTKGSTLSYKKGSTLSDLKGTTLSDLKGTTLSYKKFTVSDTKDTTLFDLKGTTLSDLKGTTLSDLKGTTLSYRKDTVSDTKNTTLFDLKGTTLFDLKGTTLSDLKGTTLSDLKGTTLSDLKGTTLSDLKGTTLSDLKDTILSYKKGTMSDMKGTTLPGTKGTTLSGTKGTTLSGTKGTTLSGTKGTTLSGTKGTTLSGTKGTTLSGTKGTTLSGQNNTLSYRISSTLCDRKSITSDRSNATLADRIITYEPDRNTTALLDIVISNVPKQNTTMLSNRITTVSPVGEPSTALSLNNSARKQESLTTAMPSGTSSFVSETVSNDEGAEKYVASGEKTQQILKEVADKLSKILPDTSFVKYLTDPDFYFFISLMPLIHMLSLQQKVHAQIAIKGILYDLAYPATSTDRVTSN